LHARLFRHARLLGRQGKTGEVIDAAGWMHTGDLATIDSEGYCNIVERIKDMMIRGGENLYPREIEEFLFRYPKIQEVRLFGVADAKCGEELCARRPSQARCRNSLCAHRARW
jgi:fatty-acyl-CoA synthase